MNDDDDKGAVACRWVLNVTVELIQIMMNDDVWLWYMMYDEWWYDAYMIIGKL